MYVLWLLGSIGEGCSRSSALSITPGLVKVPGILADAGVAWVLFLYARRFGDGWLGSWSGERLGVVAAVIYLFNPGTIFNSAVWGQVDSVGTLALLATLYWLASGWTEAAAFGAVLALLVKYQFGFLIPLVAIVGLKRHLFGRSSDPEHARTARSGPRPQLACHRPRHAGALHRPVPAGDLGAQRSDAQPDRSVRRRPRTPTRG